MQAEDRNGSTPSNATDLAELVRAVGLLWKKGDEAEAATKTEFSAINQKLEIWITTNYSIQESTQSLLQLLLGLTTELKASNAYSENGKQLLEELATQLPPLQTAIDGLSDISASLGETSDSFDPALLTPQVDELKRSISTQLDEIRVALRVALKKDLTAAIENLSLLTPASTPASARQSSPVEVKLPRSVEEKLETIERRIGVTLYEVEKLATALKPREKKARNSDDPRSKTWIYKAERLMLDVLGAVLPRHLYMGIGAIVATFLVVVSSNYHGQTQVAAQFGGRGNLAQWQELLEWNQGRISECQRRDKAECLLKVPPNFLQGEIRFTTHEPEKPKESEKK